MKRFLMKCRISLALVVLLLFCSTTVIFASGNKDKSNQADATSSATSGITAENAQSLPDGMTPPPDWDGTGEPPEPPEGFDGGMMPDGTMGGRGGFGEMSAELPVNSAAGNVSSRNIISNTDDVYKNMQFTSEVIINLASGKNSYSGNASSDKVSIEKTDNGYSLSSSIKDALKITLSGAMSGTFTVEKTAGDCAIVLNDVTITAKDGPALNILSKTRTFLVTAAGSKNILTDSAARNANTKKGAVYAKAALVLCTENASKPGTLTVNGSYKHGIYSDDYIRFLNGNVAVNISARDAVRCISGFIMDDGNLTISGTGSATDEESKGIKVDGAESTSYAGEGFIVINGGTITSTTVGKAITAAWETDEDAETETTADDPNPYVVINGGVLNIVTTATPYEKTLSDGTTVSCSPEGLEAKTDLTINGGNIKIRTADDCINAGVSITINGGTIDIASSSNDAVDSNGNLTINDGSIIAAGGNDPECAFDCDVFDFIINGGSIIGTGGSNISNPSSKSEQCVVVWYSTVTEGKTLAVKNSSGKTILECTASASFSAMVFSSPLLKTGEKYTINDGTTVLDTFTVASSVTTVGTASRGGFGGRNGMGQAGIKPDGNFNGRKDNAPENAGGVKNGKRFETQ